MKKRNLWMGATALCAASALLAGLFVQPMETGHAGQLVSPGFSDGRGVGSDSDLVVAPTDRLKRTMATVRPELKRSTLDMDNPEIQRVLTFHPPSMEGAGEDLIRRSREVMSPPPLVHPSEPGTSYRSL